MSITQLEEFSIFALGLGLAYTIGVMVFDSGSFNFYVLSTIILIALILIGLQKYLVHKYTRDKINQLCAKMSKRLE